MTLVLHITPHLGGGVGKALSSLFVQAKLSATPFQHIIVCLEKPEKKQFLEVIRSSGGEVIVAPDLAQINALIAQADVVQLEWWNHPAIIKCLYHVAPIPMRLVVWCHVSGLHTPIIPPKLIDVSNTFLFTSPCSLEATKIAPIVESMGSKLGVVSSGGGLANLPEPLDSALTKLSVGYLGSLNFAKLHPNYVEFLAAVNLPDFKVRMIGDTLNREILERQSVAIGRPGMLDFRGYTTDVAAELSQINVMAYLLNPMHYGTAENALLETMAMGIVPVVLNNSAESCIVEHQQTGFVVHGPSEFADTLLWLHDNPAKRSVIGGQAAASVRKRFTSEIMSTAFRAHYEEAMRKDKRTIPFKTVFGGTPEEWFLSCQGSPEIFKNNGQIDFPSDGFSSFNLLEKTKGSAAHFLNYNPEALLLRHWVDQLARHI